MTNGFDNIVVSGDVKAQHTTVDTGTINLSLIATETNSAKVHDMTFTVPSLNTASSNTQSTDLFAGIIQCLNLAIPANAHYQSSANQDCGAVMNDEEKLTATSYYFSPSGEDWAVLDEEARPDEKQETATNEETMPSGLKLVTKLSPKLLALDLHGVPSNADRSPVSDTWNEGLEGAQTIDALDLHITNTQVESYKRCVFETWLDDLLNRNCPSDLLSEETPNSNTKHNGNDLNIETTTNIEAESSLGLPDLRQYIPTDTAAEFEEVLGQLEPANRDTTAGHQYAQGVVDWWYMCAVSRQLLASRQGCRSYLQEADRSVNWFWSLENGSKPLLVLPSSSLKLQAVESLISEPKRIRKVHHMNFLCEPVYQKSDTPPATSFWLISSSEVAKRNDWNGSLRRTLLSYLAAEWIDPIVFHGNDEEIPEELTGTALQEYAIGMVDKVYVPYGLWQNEQLGPYDDRPRCSEGVDCLYYKCAQVNELPRLPLHLITEEVAVVNDDGRVHPPKPSRKRLPVGKRSNLSMVYTRSDYPEPCTEITISQDVLLVCPQPFRPRHESSAVQPIYAVDLQTETSNNSITKPTPNENYCAMAANAWAYLFTETTPEICFNQAAQMIETISEAQSQYKNETSPTSKQTGLTTKEMSERCLGLFSKTEEADDVVSCGANITSDESEETSLSAGSDHTEPEGVTVLHHILKSVKDVTYEALSHNMATLAIKNVSWDRPLSQSKLIQQSFTAIFTGNGLLIPSASSNSSSQSMGQEKLPIKILAEPETEAVPKLLPVRDHPHPENTTLQIFNGANAPEPKQIIEKNNTNGSPVFTDQLSSGPYTDPEHDIVDNLSETSSAIVALMKEMRHQSSLPIEKRVVMKRDEERASYRYKQAQLLAMVENNLISSYSCIEWEDKESSPESFTESEQESNSSLCDIASSLSSSESSRRTSSQGGGDHPPKKDDAVRILDERTAISPGPEPTLHQSLIDRALSEPHAMAEADDEDYDYQSDGEGDDQKPDYENSASSDSEDECNAEPHLSDSFCDSFVIYDPIATILSPTKVSTKKPAQFDESPIYDYGICPRICNADLTLIKAEAVEEEPVKTAAISELSLTQPRTSQEASDFGKQCSPTLETEVSVAEIKVSDLTAEELAIVAVEREASEGLNDFLHRLQVTPEERDGGASAAKPNGTVIDQILPILEDSVVEEVFAPMAFDCDVSFSPAVPNLSNCLLYGSVAGYLGYRLLTAFRR